MDRAETAPTDWRQPPAGVACVTAPRAYVHDWSDYRRHERRDMLPLLPAGAQRLLDVGGGEGGFARLAERERGVQAWLLEPDAQAAAAAQAQGLRVLAGRLEDLVGPDLPLPAQGFDVITLLDVLEHLPDPVAALRRLHAALAPGGAIVIATPNIGHWPLLRDLMAGRFDRLPVGALCVTHLHHFTAHTLRETLALAGFTVECEGAPEAADADDPALRAWISAAAAAGLALDADSLRTPTLRVRARRCADVAPAPRPASP
jgi:2-polyprenyl-3-methyl-5-hydroxy-6-metoxy-1,4-benzoquinol methylase